MARQLFITVLHYFIERSFSTQLWTLSHEAPWKASADRFPGPQKQSGGGMINHDYLAAFQIQTDYTRRFVATSVMWSVKMTPGMRKPGCGVQHCQSGVGWSDFLTGPFSFHFWDFQGTCSSHIHWIGYISIADDLAFLLAPSQLPIGS